MATTNHEPNTVLRCPACEKAHYDDNYYRCTECGALL